MIRKPFVILVADPDPLSAKTIAEMLKARGYAVSSVTGVAEGTRVMDTLLFDTVIVSVDSHPSTLDHSFIALARNRNALIRVVGIGSGPTPASVAGMDAYLRKPLTLEQLEETISRLGEPDTRL